MAALSTLRINLSREVRQEAGRSVARGVGRWSCFPKMEARGTRRGRRMLMGLVEM